jgi:hypothetical protein
MSRARMLRIGLLRRGSAADVVDRVFGNVLVDLA